MDTAEILDRAQAGLNVKRVFSDPIEQGGSVVVLAATVRGGAGGGTGEGPTGQGQGQGSGFGLSAKPAGAYLFRNGKVHWRPALDLNRVILGGQVVAITALLLARALVRLRNDRLKLQALAGFRLGRRWRLRHAR
jgi:uncharacterized spore protein YtfJ